MTPQQKHEIIDSTRHWISEMVIGLNLCPFARRVFQENLIRYTVTEVADAESLRTVLAEELEILGAADATSVETTLLIHPEALRGFWDFCDFLPVAESLVRSRGFRGVIQVASFHPDFQFKGTDPAAVENYTNRSPFPMLHLLRESGVAAAADSHPREVGDIPTRNIARLRELGLEKIRELSRGPGRSTHAV